jgi:Carbohydrate-selective porin, OprB family/S-layer homology domain
MTINQSSSPLWQNGKFLLATIASSLTIVGMGAAPAAAMVSDRPEVIDRPDGNMAQVTSVSQLSDVKPTDWAFQALQSLVERYGCIVGYPDRTYRGNRALTRYEFAAGLNACMDRVNELIAAATGDLAKKEDLATLQKLQAEFAAELATLRGRVDSLEGKVATLEKQQFSTTTKLTGEVVVGLAGVAAGEGPGRSATNKNTVLGYRARLNLDTSYTGEDLLRTRLQAGNLPGFSDTATGTPEGDLRYAIGDNNSVAIDALLYQFPLGKNTQITLEANAGAADDFVNTLNPYLDGDGGSGALTNFGSRNPIYYLLGGAGIGIKHKFSEALEVSAGYLAGGANDPSRKAGLFDGPYGAIAQVTFTPSAQLGLGFTYVNAYKNDFVSGGGSAGTRLANLFSTNDAVFGAELPTTSNAFGIQGSYKLTPNIVINGNIGYTNTKIQGVSGNLDIWNWAIGLAFPDLLKKGNLAGIIVGQEPTVKGVDGLAQAVTAAIDPVLYANGRNRNSGLHIEAFYQYQLNDQISITPGLIWLTAPDADTRNKDTVIGTIRTTFSF